MNRVRPFDFPRMIRIGSQNDGGYVVPHSSGLKLTKLISFGYGYNANFEFDTISKFNINEVYLYDYSISSLFSTFVIDFKHFLKNCFSLSANTITAKYFKNSQNFLTVKLNRSINYRPLKLVGNSENVNDIDFKIIENTIGFTSSIIKMDIEGSEFDVLNDENFKYLNSAQIVIIEFHDLISREIEFDQILNLFEENFYLINTHINNFGRVSKYGVPDVIELSFITKRYPFPNPKFVDKIPNNLDISNNVNEPDILFDYT
jgi:hypothetical protein